MKPYNQEQSKKAQVEEMFDNIERHSDRKAREMGFDGANEEYFMEIYTHNSNEHY